MPKECWFCKGKIKKSWTIRVKKVQIGDYCSKKCAESDCWGPRFRNAVIVHGSDNSSD